MQSDTSRIELPVELESLLQLLRKRVRQYALMSGLFGLVIAVAIAFWFTMGLDVGWFALQRLELPVGFRAVLLAAILAWTAWLVVRNIAGPAVRRITNQDLAILLEQQYPEFQDRLITAVEASDGLPHSGPQSSAMLARTVAAASSVSANADVDGVFDRQPVRQRGWAAAILALSIAGLGAAAPESLPRWWRAFVRCDDVYHQRTTQLAVCVIQQPDDRRVSFLDESGQPLYRHPRGNDLELAFEVPDELSPAGVPWIVPDRVRVDVRRTDGTTSRTYVAVAGDRQFRFVATRLQGDLEIEVLAGDYRLPQPLLVQSVAAPVVDSVQLDCQFPEYTGWNQLRETSLTVAGSEAALPIGTRFKMNAMSNKPLQAVRILSDTFELTGDHESSLQTFRDGSSSVAGPPLLSPDGTQITSQFLLQPEGDSETLDTAGASNVLRLSPNTTLKFSLHDTDNVMSIRPVTFRLRGIADRPPVVDVHVDGVDRAVTRRAVIPFIGSIKDDYGLIAAGFEFSVDDETQWRPRPFSEPLDTNATEFTVGRPEQDTGIRMRSIEYFQVQPLELTEGQTITLAVVAADGCEIGAANETRGEPLVFRIVSNEELLSLLYTREINLRRRFEDVIRAIEQVRGDLRFHQPIAKRIESATSQSTGDDQTGLMTAAVRSGDVLRRQTNELKSIVLGFDTIIQQLINNAVPPARLSESMRDNIVKPLQQVVTADLPRADRSVSRFRVAATSKQPVAELIADAEREVSQVAVLLRRVLEDVRDMAEFHEVLADLRAMQEEQKRIMRDTKRLKRQRLIDGL